MHQVPLQEAGARLSELIQEAQAGEDVVITQDETALVKLVPIEALPARARRQAGSASGVFFYMADDFDETPEDFKEHL